MSWADNIRVTDVSTNEYGYVARNINIWDVMKGTGMVLERTIYNNGYGCSCCRKDWEETEWINEDDMLDFSTLLTNKIKELNKNANDGGCVGIIYEKDGKTVYGIDVDIYKVGWRFYAVFGGDADYEYDNKLLIEGYDDMSREKSYSINEIISLYNESIKGDNDETL